MRGLELPNLSLLGWGLGEGRESACLGDEGTDSLQLSAAPHFLPKTCMLELRTSMQ